MIEEQDGAYSISYPESPIKTPFCRSLDQAYKLYKAAVLKANAEAQMRAQGVKTAKAGNALRAQRQRKKMEAAAAKELAEA